MCVRACVCARVSVCTRVRVWAHACTSRLKPPALEALEWTSQNMCKSFKIATDRQTDSLPKVRPTLELERGNIQFFVSGDQNQQRLVTRVTIMAQN